MGWRVSGHPTGPAAPGQGQGAVVALLVPCQTSPLRPLVVLHPDVSQSIHSLKSTHRRAPNPLSKMPGCPQPTQPPSHPQSHNRSSLVSHTLWHVLGISECVPEGICAMCRRGVVPYCVICAVYMQYVLTWCGTIPFQRTPNISHRLGIVSMDEKEI